MFKGQKKSPNKSASHIHRSLSLFLFYIELYGRYMFLAVMSNIINIMLTDPNILSYRIISKELVQCIP